MAVGQPVKPETAHALLFWSRLGFAERVLQAVGQVVVLDLRIPGGFKNFMDMEGKVVSMLVPRVCKIRM